MPKDFVDELIEERTGRNPRFPDLVAETERRRDLSRRLAERRQASGLSQTVVAARMSTAASVVSKLEAGGDVRLSTSVEVRNVSTSLPKPTSGSPPPSAWATSGEASVTKKTDGAANDALRVILTSLRARRGVVFLLTRPPADLSSAVFLTVRPRTVHASRDARS